MTITVDIRPEVEAELAASLREEAGHPAAGAVTNAGNRKREGAKSLVEVCAMVRGLTADADFSRNPDTGRPVDLS